MTPYGYVEGWKHTAEGVRRIHRTPVFSPQQAWQRLDELDETYRHAQRVTGRQHWSELHLNAR